MESTASAKSYDRTLHWAAIHSEDFVTGLEQPLAYALHGGYDEFASVHFIQLESEAVPWVLAQQHHCFEYTAEARDLIRRMGWGILERSILATAGVRSAHGRQATPNYQRVCLQMADMGFACTAPVPPSALAHCLVQRMAQLICSLA